MCKKTIIKYLPNTTTKEELKLIRQQYNNKDIQLILVISGSENLMDNLQAFILD